MITEAGTGDIRPDVGGRKCQEKDQAYDPGEKVRSEELVTPGFVLAGDEDVVDDPEQIAAKIYNQKLGDKGKPVIQGAGDVVPRQIESQKLRSAVHCEIDCHSEDQRKYRITRQQPLSFLSNPIRHIATSKINTLYHRFMINGTFPQLYYAIILCC